MITDVVSGGCSYTWGQELENRDKRFTKIISDSFNATLHDTSMPGSCNQLICTDVIDKVLDLIHNQKISSEKIFVVINWTFLERLPYYNPNKDSIETVKFRNVEDYENLKDKRTILDIFIKNRVLKNTTELNIKKFNTIKDWWYDHTNIHFLKYHFFNLLNYIQSFLKFNKVKYLFTFSDIAVDLLLHLQEDKCSTIHTDDKYEKEKIEGYEIPHRTSIENILKTIDTTYVYMGVNIAKYENLGFKFGPRYHPLEPAHIYFAEELIEFIHEKYPDIYVNGNSL